MMSQENNTKKTVGRKKNLFGKILDAICFTICILILFALIILRTPWTVIAVYIAILLVNTVVPKPVRKWIWLTVVIFIIALVVWVFLPDETEGWRPYTFDEELAAMEAKRFVPAEDNAATIYKQLLKSYDPNSFSKEFLSWEKKDLILLEFWKSKDYPEAASWLQDNQKIIDQLILACKKNKCRFPIAGDINASELKPPCNFKEVTDFWWSSYKRLTPKRRWSELLIISANNDIAEGRVDQGLKKYITTLQMAKHLYQQPSISDLIAGKGIEGQVLMQINRFVINSDSTDKHLLLLDEALQNIEYDWRSDLLKILDRKKLMFKNFMCAMFYQTNSEGRIRLNRDPWSTLRAQFQYTTFTTVHGKGYKPMNPDSYCEIKLTKAMTMFWWFFAPSTLQEVSIIIDDIHKQYYEMAKSEFDWEKEHEKFSLKSVRLNFRCLLEMMSRILEDNWSGIHDLYLRITSYNRSARIIIALRLYKNENGHWPETLEDVEHLASPELFVDPINNDSFIYRLTEDGFTLYSKGKNNIDENGDRRTKKPDGTKTDDFLIWPPKSRQTRKELPIQPN